MLPLLAPSFMRQVSCASANLAAWTLLPVRTCGGENVAAAMLLADTLAPSLPRGGEFVRLDRQADTANRAAARESRDHGMLSKRLLRSGPPPRLDGRPELAHGVAIGTSTTESYREVVMKITEIREKTFPISSPIRNAYIDFSKMTLSLVAVVTDVVRDGKRVVGYGFNSNGRYGQGTLMRERFIPRLLEADPKSLVTEDGSNLDPHKVWNCMYTNEKPGGHGERSVAIGTIDMAVWDCVAKIEGKPLFQLLAERYGNGKPNRKVFVYAAGGYYYPGQNYDALKDEMRSYIDRGYTVVKKKIGGASLDEDLRRIDAILSVLQRRPEAVCRRQRALRLGHRHRVCKGALSVRSVLVRGARRSARFRAAGGLCAITTTNRWRRAKTCFPCRTRAI